MIESLKKEIYADNVTVTQAIATQLAQLVSAGTIILLEGNLGSGKTTFMQAFGRALGIKSTIASPTFTLIDEYTEGRIPLYHVDLYRLEPAQVPSLHLEEYWRGEDFPLGIVAIEWASKLINIPPSYLKIHLEVIERSPSNQKSHDLEDIPQKRLIQLIAKGAFYVELLNRFDPQTRFF